MKCLWSLYRKIRKSYLKFFVFLLCSVVSFCSVSLMSFADDLSNVSEVVQADQTEPEEPARSEPDEAPEDVQNDQTGDESFDGVGDALGTPDEWPEWLGDEPEDLGPMAVAYTDENTAQLARIEYHLSIISGGVILAVCSLFTWFMIIKPIKQFIVF